MKQPYPSNGMLHVKNRVDIKRYRVLLLIG